jgi:hypothetical protein
MASCPCLRRQHTPGPAPAPAIARSACAEALQYARCSVRVAVCAVCAEALQCARCSVRSARRGVALAPHLRRRHQPRQLEAGSSRARLPVWRRGGCAACGVRPARPLRGLTPRQCRELRVQTSGHGCAACVRRCTPRTREPARAVRRGLAWVMQRRLEMACGL